MKLTTSKKLTPFLLKFIFSVFFSFGLCGFVLASPKYVFGAGVPYQCGCEITNVDPSVAQCGGSNACSTSFCGGATGWNWNIGSCSGCTGTSYPAPSISTSTNVNTVTVNTTLSASCVGGSEKGCGTDLGYTGAAGASYSSSGGSWGGAMYTTWTVDVSGVRSRISGNATYSGCVISYKGFQGCGAPARCVKSYTYTVTPSNQSPQNISASMSSSSVISNGSTNYYIQRRVRDPNGPTDIKEIRALVNLQGTYAGQSRGYFRWTKDWATMTDAFYWDNPPSGVLSCSGGGYADKDNNEFGYNYVDLTSCTTWTSGNDRYVRFYFHANTNWTSPTGYANDVSGWVRDNADVCVGWSNYNLNFRAGNCFSGDCCSNQTFRASSYVCRADAGDCDVAETCTGSSSSCPGDSYEPSGTACNDGDYCTATDTCNGSGTCVGTGDRCGDGTCNCGETSSTCPADCNEGPQNVTTSISSSSLTSDGLTSYYIYRSAQDSNGVSDINDIRALINLQGGRAGQYRGYLRWDKSSTGWLQNMACSGGGYAGKWSAYGPSYIDLTSCTTYTLGDQRVVLFYFHANTNWTSPTGYVNDISGWVMDDSGLTDGWDNYNLNFRAGQCFSGTCCYDQAFVPSGTVCYIDVRDCYANSVCSGSSADCPPSPYEPSGTLCDDGDYCTAIDTCNGSGTCVGTGDRCGDGTCNCGETPATCPADCNSAPVANSTTELISYPVRHTVDLTAADSDSDDLTFALTATPSHGSIHTSQGGASPVGVGGNPCETNTRVGVTSTCVTWYQPIDDPASTPSWTTGIDTFTFKVNDGTVDSVSDGTATMTVTRPAWFQVDGGGIYSGAGTATTPAIDTLVPSGETLTLGDGIVVETKGALAYGGSAGSLFEDSNTSFEVSDYSPADAHWDPPNYRRLANLVSGNEIVSFSPSLDFSKVYYLKTPLDVSASNYKVTDGGVVVIYVASGGNLTFTGNFIADNPATQGIIFVVEDGNITINSDVTQIDAILLADDADGDGTGGNITINGVLDAATPLTINGSLLAHTHVNLGTRSLTDNTTPAIQINYKLLYITQAEFITTSMYSWEESEN